MAPPDLASCGLPEAWAGRSAWTVLDTDFGDGRHFLHTWRAWQADPQRPRMLHYVGIAASSAECAAALSLPVPVADLGPGFHRLLLDGGRVSLTLCLGSTTVMLTEQVFQADTVFARAPSDKWEVQALARRCKRGSRFTMASHASATTLALLSAAGFQFEPTSSTPSCTAGRFDPRWDIPTSRTRLQHVQLAPARCAVIGAGIAGASVAHALALRGWQVTVLDQAPHPSAGASGLPVGLAVPHVSGDDNPRSRLSRSGLRLLHQHAQRLLVQGQDWDPTGVTERKPDGRTLWHAAACWVKPAQLVQAWLAEPGIRFAGRSTVTTLQRHEGLWHLGDAQEQDFGGFEAVVVANAIGSVELLRPHLGSTLPALQAMHGTLSHGDCPSAPIDGVPTTPVNGNGCFIPHVPSPAGPQWFAGSTFETDIARVQDAAAQHSANMERLRQLLATEGAGDVVERLNRGPVGQWSGTRCVTHDRLPLVGPIDTAAGPGLWLCVGMGSRGLSFSALCAELLLARMGAEPLPMEFSLSRSLDANRTRRAHPAPTQP